MLLRRGESTRRLLDAHKGGQRFLGGCFRGSSRTFDAISDNGDPGTTSRDLFGEAPKAAGGGEPVSPPLWRNRDSQALAPCCSRTTAHVSTFRGVGVRLGPDLASVVSNGREKLPGFGAGSQPGGGTDFSPADGHHATARVGGILVRDSDASVTLKQAGGGGSVARKDLVGLVPEGRSLCRRGLESGRHHLISRTSWRG